MNWDDALRRLLEFILSTVLTIASPSLATENKPRYSPPGELATERARIQNLYTRPKVDRIRQPTWHLDPEISWYGPNFYGHRTACGFTLDKSLQGVAHRSLPCGTRVEFRWNGEVLDVPVIDRGPYVQGRQWDLTGGACMALRHCFTGPIEWRIIGGGG